MSTYTSKVDNREKLVAYIKSKLGLGVTYRRVEISEIQYDTLIDDAIELFMIHGYSGHDRGFIEMNTVKGQLKYKVPSDIMEVIKIIEPSLTRGLSGEAMIYESTRSQVSFNSTYNYVDYQIMQFNISETEKNFRTRVSYNFNASTKELTIFDSSNVDNHKKLLLECYLYPGETQVDFDSIYGHIWIKDHCVGLAYEQWYRNLAKFGKTKIQDGEIEIDVPALKTLGDEILERTREDILDMYSNPLGIWKN